MPQTRGRCASPGRRGGASARPARETEREGRSATHPLAVDRVAGDPVRDEQGLDRLGAEDVARVDRGVDEACAAGLARRDEPLAVGLEGFEGRQVEVDDLGGVWVGGRSVGV